MHATSRTQLENRSLQYVECPVQERAALLSRSYPSLRLNDLTRTDLETLGSYTEVFRAEEGTMIFHEATPGDAIESWPRSDRDVSSARWPSSTARRARPRPSLPKTRRCSSSPGTRSKTSCTPIRRSSPSCCPG